MLKKFNMECPGYEANYLSAREVYFNLDKFTSITYIKHYSAHVRA